MIDVFNYKPQDPNKKYYGKRGNAYERQSATSGNIVRIDVGVDFPIELFEMLFCVAQTSDPTIGRDQSDEYGIFYDIR